VEQKLGMTNLSDIPNFVAVYAPTNGVINVQLTLRAMHDLAAKHGAHLKSHTVVENIKVDKSSQIVTVHANHGIFKAKKVVLTLGAFTNDLLKPCFDMEINMEIWEMIYAYYKMDAKRSPLPCLWFQLRESRERLSNLYYGIPPVPWGIVDHARIAVDYSTNFYHNFVPKQRPNSATEADLAMTREFIEKHIPGCEGYPAFQGSCLAPNTPDNNFVLDWVPNTDKMVSIFCCGWGFKFVPLLGKILSQMAMDGKVESAYADAMKYFTITRKGLLKTEETSKIMLKTTEATPARATHFVHV